jgi:5-methylcytosine-specific restriction endonuclease McrA
MKIQKANLPKALREQVWLRYAGRAFECKCIVPWCTNIMTVFDFHVGHDIPESLGGTTEIANLRPICARCNLSMGSQYTVQEWSILSRPMPPSRFRFLCWPRPKMEDAK